MIPALAPLSTLALHSVTLAPAAPALAPQGAGLSTPITVDLFHEELDFDGVDYDFDQGAWDDLGLPGNAPKEALDRASRHRTGARVSFGDDLIRGYGQVFAEHVEARDPLPDFPGVVVDSDFSGFGLGAGVLGRVPLGAAAFRYRGGLNLAFTDSDDRLESLGIEDDLTYLELEAEAAVEGELNGFQPGLGIYANSISGEVDYLGYSDDISGTNVGLFAGIGLATPDSPIHGSLRVFFGDVEGFVLTLGFQP
jgi:hypothetical protein